MLLGLANDASLSDPLSNDMFFDASAEQIMVDELEYLGYVYE